MGLRGYDEPHPLGAGIYGPGFGDSRMVLRTFANAVRRAIRIVVHRYLHPLNGHHRTPVC